MEQCPIKEMEIEFQCVIDTENSLFEPVPAKKIKPEWYKKLPALVKDEFGQRLDTIKKCPAMHDWLSMGYLVRNRHTILVFLGQNKKNAPISVAYTLKDLNTDQLSTLKKLIKENDGDKIAEYIIKNELRFEELDGREYNYAVGGHPAKQVAGMRRDDKMQIKMDMDFIIKKQDEVLTWVISDFFNLYNKTRVKFVSSKTLKEKSKKGLKIIEQKLLKFSS